MSNDSSSDSGSGNSGQSGTPPSKKPRAFKKRDGHLTAAGDVLQGLLQNSKSTLSDGFLRWKLEQQWNEIVGATIGEQTLPAAYQRGTLHIWVRHPAWMQQLWFFQDTIKEKVNSHLGCQWVNEVRFTLNRRAASTEPGSSPR